MSSASIREAIIGIEKYFNSDKAPGPRPDIPATAMVEDGLRCWIHSPDGKGVHSDMNTVLGGGVTANSPGWLARAALASCDATVLAMRAARLGVELESIEVSVEAASDGRGLLLDSGISPGSTGIRVRFRVGADDVSREQVREMVDWVVLHSPIGCDFEQAVPVDVELELV